MALVLWPPKGRVVVLVEEEAEDEDEDEEADDGATANDCVHQAWTQATASSRDSPAMSARSNSTGTSPSTVTRGEDEVVANKGGGRPGLLLGLGLERGEEARGEEADEPMHQNGRGARAALLLLGKTRQAVVGVRRRNTTLMMTRMTMMADHGLDDTRGGGLPCRRWRASPRRIFLSQRWWGWMGWVSWFGGGSALVVRRMD